MNWVVTVENATKDSFRYWVEAQSQKDAEARGFRLHCASENFKANGRDRVTGCKQAAE